MFGSNFGAVHTAGAADSVFALASSARTIVADRALFRVRIAVGFGISNARHVRAVGLHADGAIVGSALVRRLDDARLKGDDPVAVATEFVRTLRGSPAIASQ